MKITMISNYINHHQIPFSDALYDRIKDGYCFIQTEPMEEERIRMGWGMDVTKIPYVRFLYEDEKICKKMIEECDILLVGWMEREDLIVKRLKENRLTIRISERLYREGQYKAISPRGLFRKYKEHTRFRKSNAYLLCAGAYVPSDFHIIRAYPQKMYRFGYFPKTRRYDEEEFFSHKPPLDTIQIVWAGRFLPLKHPEFAVRIAKDLKERGYSFQLHMIGSGEMEDEIRQQISEGHLQNEVVLYGFQKPDEVRNIMERCHIHLFTSNHLEGWGAVVNEGMNSGLAEVVNSEVGCAPFLIRHKENGLIYKEGSYKDFQKCVLDLFEHRDKIAQLGKNAYRTILNEWNAQHAAEELLSFYEHFKKGFINPPTSGPFSVAPVISPKNMYRKMME